MSFKSLAASDFAKSAAIFPMSFLNFGPMLWKFGLTMTSIFISFVSRFFALHNFSMMSSVPFMSSAVFGATTTLFIGQRSFMSALCLAAAAHSIIFCAVAILLSSPSSILPSSAAGQAQKWTLSSPASSLNTCSDKWGVTGAISFASPDST